MSAIPWIIVFGFVIFGGILLWATLRPFQKDGRTKVNPTLRKRPILLDTDWGSAEILKVTREGANGITVKLSNGLNQWYPKGTIIPMDTTQTLCGNDPPLYVYDPTRRIKSNGNEEEIKTRETNEVAHTRRIAGLHAENNRLKQELKRSLDRWVEYTKATTPGLGDQRQQ